MHSEFVFVGALGCDGLVGSLLESDTLLESPSPDVEGVDVGGLTVGGFPPSLVSSTEPSSPPGASLVISDFFLNEG